MLTEVLPVLLASALLAGFALWIYTRRELPVPGRGGLAALRVAFLVLLVVLIADPALPGRAAATSATRWVLLDASRSMTAARSDGAPEVPLEQALARARTLEGGGARVLVLGDPPLALEGADSLTAPQLADRAPTDAPSRLLPAVRRAAESGARDIVLLSDLRLDDAPTAAAELARLGVAVEVEDMGGPVRSAGIARLEAPATARAGARVEVAVEAFATESAAGDSADLVLTRDGEVEASWRVRLPAPGGTVRRSAEVTLPDRAGAVRFLARVDVAGDGFSDDDERSRVTEVDPSTGVVALVALVPDWEPRFLLPALGAVTGLPTRGWLRVGEDRYLPMEGGAAVPASELASVVADAALVVFSGRDRDEPSWVAPMAASARRVISLARDESGAAAAGVGAGPARPGEWYVASPPPPSALTASLAGVAAGSLPPLTHVLPVVPDQPGVPALLLRGPGGQAPVPAMVLVEAGGDDRREAVALASGFWRWAFREGEPREAYRSLWSAVAGWLLALDDGRGVAGVTPAAPVVAADRPVSWRAPVARGGQVELTVQLADSTERVDTLDVAATGDATGPSLPAGRHAWRARLVTPDTAEVSERVWQGTLIAERWTGELLPARLEPGALAVESSGGVAGSAVASGIPLRTRPWPYLVLLALLALEWIGRRRRGLR